MNNAMCSKCQSETSLSYHAYCMKCVRISKGRSVTPKFYRDPSNKLCSKCRTQPRATGKNYCSKCANDYLNKWREGHGGSWKCLTESQKEKAKVRRFIHHRIEAGTVDRKPCEVCGNPDTQVHHLDYAPRTLNVIHLCQPHHLELEKLKKNGLTDQDAVKYLSSVG